MTCSDPREEACHRFIEGYGVAYIRARTVDGASTCVLFDDDGEEIATSYHGMVPLISFAFNHGITLVTLQ